MNIDELTIGELRQVAKLAHAIDGTSQPQTQTHIPPTRKSIVRSRDHGVVYGEVLSIDGRTVTVKNARQMWSWKAATGFVLIDVANYGCVASECKFSSPSTSPILMLESCAVIEMTDTAIASCDAVPNHKG